MKKNLSLWAFLSLFLIGVLTLILSIFYYETTHESYQIIRTQEERFLKTSGRMIAKNQQIIAMLKQGESDQQVQDYTLALAEDSDLDYIVVMDLSGTRLTHPNPSKIGESFQGGDEKAVLNGQEILSVAEGSLGESLRYIVPVYDGKQQIGAVAVGLKLTTLSDISQQNIQQYTRALVISILLSLLVTSSISYFLKKRLHNLEPNEIFQNLEERNAMLEQTHASVFVLDQQHYIQRHNPAATRLLGAYSDNKKLIGERLDDLLPMLNEKHFATQNEQIVSFRNQDYLLSIFPIVVQNQNRGYVVFMRNATETLLQMEQLAYTTTYASALQAQTHSFMNQLHVIYGLVDIAYYDELKVYLKELLEPRNEFLTSLSMLIKDPQLASFLIGEKEKFSEKHTQLQFEIREEVGLSQMADQLHHYIFIHRYINTSLLHFTLPETIQIQLSYQDKLLQTEYRFSAPTFLSDNFLASLQEPYFQQLLADADGEYEFNTQEDMIVISTRIAY